MRRKRGRTSTPSTRTIPNDLWPDILARLPVKTLLQFRLVCMFFCSLIDSPEFATKQVKRCKENRMSTHIITQDKDTMWEPKDCVLRHIDTYRKTRNFQFEPHISIPKHNYKIVQGFVNGLVLMQMTRPQQIGDSHNDPDVLVIWNPSIRKHIKFVAPRVPPFYNSTLTHICFGFDPVSNDYKLSMICYPYGFLNKPVNLYITRLNNNPNREWTTKIAPKLNLYVSGKCVYLDGHVYMTGSDNWTVNLDPHMPHRNTHLIAFDLGNETITCDTALPESNDKNIERYLIKFGESSIALFDSGYYKNSIWVMEKFDGAITWSLKYKFDLKIKLGYYMCIAQKGLMLYESGERKDRSGVLSYDLETGDKKCIAKTSYFLKNVRSACIYEESLVHFTPPPPRALVAPRIEVKAEVGGKGEAEVGGKGRGQLNNN